MALAPFTYFSFLWWGIGVVDALTPILHLCCCFSPLYPACLLLTVLLLRRAAAGCQRPAELFRSGRRMWCAITGVAGCCALFPLSLLFSLNGNSLLYSSEYYFPLHQLSALSGTIHMGKGFAWTLVLLLVGLALCLFALVGLTISAVLGAKNRRVDEE